MPTIEFRGKTYNNEFEMPLDVREAYNREKEGRAKKNNTGTKSLTDIVDMSPEVQAIYERALGKAEEKLASSRPSIELPKTEDIYRQSAPDDMKHLPSDESIYRPSEPLIDSTKSAIEPEPAFAMKRFISSLVWALLIVVVLYFALQFLH